MTNTLHWIWMIDCSGSLHIGDAIGTLNHGIPSALNGLSSKFKNDPNILLKVSLVAFADSVHWLAQDMPVKEVKWQPLQAAGVTSMGQAFTATAHFLETIPADPAHYAVICLLSDGMPTDEYQSPLGRFVKLNQSRQYPVLALGIGEEVDPEPLKQLTSHVFFAEVRQLSPALEKMHNTALESCQAWLAQAKEALPTTETTGSPEAEASSPVQTPEVRDILNAYHNRPNEFATVYPVLKIGPQTRDFIKTKTKPLFVQVKSSAPIFSLKLQNGDYIALPNPTMTYTAKIFDETGVSHWFDTGLAKLPERFKIQVIKPAVILKNTADDSWLCTQNGQLKLS